MADDGNEPEAQPTKASSASPCLWAHAIGGIMLINLAYIGSLTKKVQVQPLLLPQLLLQAVLLNFGSPSTTQMNRTPIQ